MTERPVPCIETRRCVLTLLAPEHAELLLAYRTKNLAHLAPWEPAPESGELSLKQACQRAAATSRQDYAAGSAVKLIAISRSTQGMVAACSFTNIVRGPFQACHLGYSVDCDYQGQGLMHEVLQSAIGYMFDELGLHRIMANHMPVNTRSENLLCRLGFEREGYARAYLKIAGRWEDMVLNALVNPGP